MKVQNSEKDVSQKNKTEKKKNATIEPPVVEETHYAINPPNGGWGWFVVLSALYCNLVVDGIQLTFGIFLSPIAESFNAHFSEVSLAGSLMFGIHLIMGPLCAGCNNAFGLRPVTITGSLICCFGVGISYFATGYLFLSFTLGVIGGMGLGLVYMNTLVITSLYFTTMLPVAVGIVVCGSGIGSMVFTGLGSVLLKMTTWQNSFLIQAAFAGSMGIAAIVFRPLKPTKVIVTVSESEEKNAGPSSIKKNSVFVETGLDPSQSTLQEVAWGFAQKMVEEEENKRRCSCSKCCKRKKKEPENEIIISLSQMKIKDSKLYTENNATKTGKSEKKRSQPVYKRIEFSDKKAKNKAWAPIKQAFLTMFDCSLLRSFSFFLFTISGAIHVAALLVVFTYEKERAIHLGFSENMSVLLLISLGGSSVFWRLTLGIIAAFVKVNYTLLLILGNVIGGLATLSSGFIANIYYEFISGFLFSLSLATGAVFRVVLLVELVGVEKITVATGINLLFMGIFCIISPPLFGLIMEATKSYQILFCITGGLTLLSGLMLIGVKKVEIKNKKNKNTEEKS